jgi:hypothetical protein
MLVFPTAFFRVSAKDCDYDLPSVTGGRALSGDEDRVFTTGGGQWYAEFSDVALTTRERQLTWRAFRSATNGGVDPFVFPLCEARQQAFVPDGWVGGVPFSDGTSFSDDSLFAGAASEITAAADAALRATSLSLAITALPVPLIGGERFSIDHPTWRHRCYQVGRIISQSDTAAEIQFHPPLREAVTEGTVIDFNNPRFVAHFQEVRAPMLNPKFARGSARLVEDMRGSYS